MKLTDSKDIISSFLKTDVMVLNLEQKQKISQAFAIAITDIDAIVDPNKELEKSTEKFSDVIVAFSLLCEIALTAPISDGFSIFLFAYSELMYNWNANTYQDPVMKAMSLMLSRLVESRDMIVRTTSIIKDASVEMLDIANWSPPSYEVAKTYLENLLEENEKGKE